ncbi:hypothetical protein YA0089_26620 [Pseudomonas viridiflava]|uniref:hypothetical protein n=1 Tax=Pseudomonas viridiflava TaxID=33069 RepID=UPI0018E5CA85|nr:hypothetical protein [Pseudomonas viridiflava]MBI6727192.1 hypothetical protein [Pseudomonas viridiflava]
MLIDVTARDWAFAALLGQARRQSNNTIRKTNRDRGDQKNIHVDLMGSISEILALKYFRGKITPTERRSTMAAMFRPEGGGGKLGADLKLSQLGLTLDVKTFDCEDNKRFFAINSSKHADLMGACDGYLCVICPKYSTQAFIVDHVPYAEVTAWPSKALGGYGDASYNLPIGDFLSRYAGNSSLKHIKSSQKYSKDEISDAIHDDVNLEMFYNLFPGSENFAVVSRRSA